jgi:hypothetical protein
MCELENSRAHRESEGNTSFVPIYMPCHHPSVLICLKRTKEKQGMAHFVLGYPTLPLPQIIRYKQGRVGSILVCLTLLDKKKGANFILVCPTTHLINFFFLFFPFLQHSANAQKTT